MNAIARLNPLSRDRSRQAAAQVADALREAILGLDLLPGTVLPRPELARHYGVSQTPVRDALTRLGEEGLVDIYPQHATLVSRIDVAAALQAHFLRRALELEIVRELAAAPAERRAPVVVALQGRIAEQKRAHAAQDYAAFTQADRAFHQALYEGAGMAALWPLVRQKSGHVDRLRRLHLPTRGKAASVLRDHAAITGAIQAHAPARAQAALRVHLSGTLSFVDTVRREHPQWVVG